MMAVDNSAIKIPFIDEFKKSVAAFNEKVKASDVVIFNIVLVVAYIKLN